MVRIRLLVLVRQSSDALIRCIEHDDINRLLGGQVVTDVRVGVDSSGSGVVRDTAVGSRATGVRPSLNIADSRRQLCMIPGVARLGFVWISARTPVPGPDPTHQLRHPPGFLRGDGVPPGNPAEVRGMALKVQDHTVHIVVATGLGDQVQRQLAYLRGGVVCPTPVPLWRGIVFGTEQTLRVFPFPRGAHVAVRGCAVVDAVEHERDRTRPDVA
jgi:hypothetical protein